jgi:hypothetical protein
MDFFSDYGSLDTAKKMVRDRHVDYVVVNPGQAFLDTTIIPPKTRLPGVAGLTLGERLCQKPPLVPDWLEPLPPHPYLFSDYPVELNIYRVRPLTDPQSSN